MHTLLVQNMFLDVSLKGRVSSTSINIPTYKPTVYKTGLERLLALCKIGASSGAIQGVLALCEFHTANFITAVFQNFPDQ